MAAAAGDKPSRTRGLQHSTPLRLPRSSYKSYGIDNVAGFHQINLMHSYINQRPWYVCTWWQQWRRHTSPRQVQASHQKVQARYASKQLPFVGLVKLMLEQMHSLRAVIAPGQAVQSEPPAPSLCVEFSCRCSARDMNGYWLSCPSTYQ